MAASRNTFPDKVLANCQKKKASQEKGFQNKKDGCIVYYYHLKHFNHSYQTTTLWRERQICQVAELLNEKWNMPCVKRSNKTDTFSIKDCRSDAPSVAAKVCTFHRSSPSCRLPSRLASLTDSSLHGQGQSFQTYQRTQRTTYTWLMYETWLSSY